MMKRLAAALLAVGMTACPAKADSLTDLEFRALVLTVSVQIPVVIRNRNLASDSSAVTVQCEFFNGDGNSVGLAGTLIEPINAGKVGFGEVMLQAAPYTVQATRSAECYISLFGQQGVKQYHLRLDGE